MSDDQPQSEATNGDRPDEGLEPAPAPAPEEPSSYVDDPLTRLWQNGDRPTGAEAVEAVRARRKAGDPANGRAGGTGEAEGT